MGHTEVVRCQHGDTVMEGVVHAPAASGIASGATVMMFPGATGSGPSFRKSAAELAALGYRVIEIEMYGAGSDISTPQAAGEHFTKLLASPGLLRDRVVTWFETIRAMPGVDPRRIAAVGYCFGGKCVLELARSGADVRAVVSYHGLLTTHAPMAPGVCKADIAVWSGGCDPYAPVADFDALRSEFDSAGARYQMSLLSTAQHSFTDPDHDDIGLEGIAYDALSHRVSWAATIAFLSQTIGTTG